MRCGMKCRKYEKSISDALDGALSPGKKKTLEDHLAGCPDCQVYKERLSMIQDEASRLEVTEVPPSYWQEFSQTLGKRLRAWETQREAEKPFRLSWKWAWLGVPVLLGSVLSFILLRDRVPPLEDDIFSYEACLDRLHQTIGDDAGFEESFNRVILGSLSEDLDFATIEESVVLSENHFFWENLNDEELQFIEQEIKKDMKS
jgi:hypothetical protein